MSGSCLWKRTGLDTWTYGGFSIRVSEMLAVADTGRIDGLHRVDI